MSLLDKTDNSEQRCSLVLIQAHQLRLRNVTIYRSTAITHRQTQDFGKMFLGVLGPQSEDNFYANTKTTLRSKLQF